MPNQYIINIQENYLVLEGYFKEKNIKKILLVCGGSISLLRINNFFVDIENKYNIRVVRFSDFSPNPTYESVINGLNIFKHEQCEMIVAVGGGSAMDVAKCIKLFANMDSNINFLEQSIVPNDIEIMAVPTTAGTGSEATRFAVIYYEGQKQSVTDISCIPSVVVFDPQSLLTLPIYQKQVTMMDALCHAIESFWSVNSTEESKKYSKEAILLIKEYTDAYFENQAEANMMMLRAANMAGKAINISQTTAGHAMSYKLTSMYNIPHGHAVALCVVELWQHMQENIKLCVDPRGNEYLQTVFKELSQIISIEEFRGLIEKIDLKKPQVNSRDDYITLKQSVNPIRLKNNPIKLDEQNIDRLYHNILAETEGKEE